MTAPTEPTTTPAAPAPTPPAPPSAPATDPAGDKPLGPAGERALQAEREARKALERQVAALEPLAKLAAALGGGDPTKGQTEIQALTERQAATERALVEERAMRWRAEVAQEKGLTAVQAARLVGTTRDEMAADADALKAAFPTTPAAPGTPAPDPSQGAGGTAPSLDARIAEAQRQGNWGLVVSLQNQKLAAAATQR